MSAAWRNALVLLLGSLLAVIAGAWLAGTARSRAGFPQELLAARDTLIEFGGEEGILRRRQKLTEIRDRLELERASKRADAAAFSQRIEEVFSELGLALTSSSEWQALPDYVRRDGAAFGRTFAGSGAFEALLDAVYTVESWPDRVEVRTLSVLPKARGEVAFTLELVAVRLHRPDTERETS